MKLVVAALAALLAVPAAPAAADRTGLFNTSAGDCGYLRSQRCAGHGQGVLLGLSSLTVTVDCTAVTPFLVDRTGVACYLYGLSDHRAYLHTGPLFVSGNVATITDSGTVPLQGYRLCVGAGYSTPWGDHHDVQGYRCE